MVYELLKLKPFEQYVGDGKVINYVGLRADEESKGFISRKSNITTVFPFRDDGLVKKISCASLRIPVWGCHVHEMGRTRSGCFFCFYQQKIEWVSLKEHHPDLFEEAKAYEEQSLLHGEAFNWNQRESLAELERPERIAEIKAKHAARSRRPSALSARTCPSLRPWVGWSLTTSRKIRPDA